MEADIVKFLQVFTGVVFNLLSFLVIARVILSWVAQGTTGGFVGFAYDVTEPLLRPIRKVLPRLMMIDFSPIILLILIDFLHYGISALIIYVSDLI